MIPAGFYGDNDCQSEFYANTFLPVDPTMCIPNPNFVGTKTVVGGFVRHCNVDGTTTTLRYADDKCLVQDPAQQLPQAWIVDGCTPGHALPGADPPLRKVTLVHKTFAKV